MSLRGHLSLGETTMFFAGETVKFMLTKKSIEERLGIDMESVAKKISLSEVLTIHGTEDATIPFQDAEEYSK